MLTAQALAGLPGCRSAPAAACGSAAGLPLACSFQRLKPCAPRQTLRVHAAAAGSGSRGGRDAGGASVTASPATAAASSRPDQAGAPQLVWAEGANNILSLNEYRRGVGLCIYRPRDGLVFAARRVDDPLRSWQMPQGGIDPLENPMRAALRELHEETAITSVRIVASIDRWLEYTWPTSVRPAPAASGSPVLKYRGQTQKWFLLEFFGDDSEIDLEACIGFPDGHGHHTRAEFSEFSWQPLASLPGGVVDFKKGVYAQVAAHFGPEIARRVGAGAAAHRR